MISVEKDKVSCAIIVLFSRRSSLYCMGNNFKSDILCSVCAACVHPIIKAEITPKSCRKVAAACRTCVSYPCHRVYQQASVAAAAGVATLVRIDI